MKLSLYILVLLEERKPLELFLFNPQLIPTTIIVVEAGYYSCEISD